MPRTVLPSPRRTARRSARCGPPAGSSSCGASSILAGLSRSRRTRSSPADVRVLVITGAPGAGKTTLLTSLAGVLEAGDVPFAAVEVEALSLVHPWPDDDAAFEHLAYVARS